MKLKGGVKQKSVRGLRAIPDPIPLGKVLVPGGMPFFMLAPSVVDLVIVGTGGCVCGIKKNLVFATGRYTLYVHSPISLSLSLSLSLPLPPSLHYYSTCIT